MRPENICVSEIKYQKYHRILKEIAVLECENGKSSQARSLRARSHNIFIDFLNVSVLSDTVVCSAIPYERIKAYTVSEALARAYKLHVYEFFFMSVHLGACSPPPIQKELGSEFCRYISTKPEEWPNEDGRSVPPPPHSLHEIAATDIVPYHKYNKRKLRLLYMYNIYADVI